MRGQTLPWVAINVVGMIMFVILLVSILSMQKNLYMTAKELDKRTALMQMNRELLASPNCFAYEATNYEYLNSTRRVALVDIINPGIIDYYKYIDFYHFNCLRYDFKYLEAKESGMTMAYATKLIDISDNKIINPPISSLDWPPNKVIYSYEFNVIQFPYEKSKNYPPNCSDKLYQIEPVLIKNGAETHLGILYFSICDDKGKNYQGTHFCEMNLKGANIKVKNDIK